jgi:hypothetical protein
MDDFTTIHDATERGRRARRAGRVRAALVGGALAATLGTTGVLAVAHNTGTSTSSGTTSSSSDSQSSDSQSSDSQSSTGSSLVTPGNGSGTQATTAGS